MADRKRSLPVSATKSATSAHCSEEGSAGDAEKAKKLKRSPAKARLVQLYGKNERSNGKLRAAKELINKRNFREIAHMLHVAEATAQIYGIDAFAAGAPIDHLWLGSILEVGEEDFKTVKDCIERSNDNKLRSIRDELETFSYNQIRFVLACMIRDLNF